MCFRNVFVTINTGKLAKNSHPFMTNIQKIMSYDLSSVVNNFGAIA